MTTIKDALTYISNAHWNENADGDVVFGIKPGPSDTPSDADPCPYAIDGCILENQEVGPCLCANPVTPRHESVAETPFGYAYEYPSCEGRVVRFGTGGREINGSKPIRAIPLYTRPSGSDETAKGSLVIIQAAIAERKQAESALTDAIATICRLSREKGEAIGKLEASEMAGVVDGWRERAEKAETALRNLLAIIHRDGGHYTEQHGIEKSVADAHQVWAKMQSSADSQWNIFPVDRPAGGRKFIATYNDGSGARLFFAFDGGFIDSDGDEYYDSDFLNEGYSFWAYLPNNMEFWCEQRENNPILLKTLTTKDAR